MSKENMKRFLEQISTNQLLAVDKAASNPELGKKLQQLESNYIEQLVLLSKEAGISLTKEDLEVDGLIQNLGRFSGQIAATPELAEKLKTLEQSCLGQIAVLAKEAGFDLEPEDFMQAVHPLSDVQIEAVTGGWNPRGPIFP